MTQPWFQVFADLPGHQKIGKLRDGLKLKNRYEAVGLLICLWSWAAVHAPSGDLKDISAQDLADAAGWRKSPKQLLEALVASGLVDQEEGQLRLHDWDDHQGMLQDAMTRAKKKAAIRQKNYRERQKAKQEALQQPSLPPEHNVTRNVTQGVTGNVTERHSNGPTITITNTYTSLSEVVSSPTLYVGPAPDGGDGADRDVLKLVGGEVGQGVLLLSDRQMDDLLGRMGIDGFNVYAKRLVAWVQKTGANVDHYREICKWWREDTAGPDIIWPGGANA